MDAAQTTMAALQERRKLLDEALPRIQEKLVSMGASLILMFGSEGRGERNPLADLDLVVVVESEEPIVERIARFYREVHAGVAMDLLVYTPEEFDRLKDTPFMRNVLSEARVLHEA